MTVMVPVSAMRRSVLVETPSFSAAFFGGIHCGSPSVTGMTLCGQPDSGQPGHAGHIVRSSTAAAQVLLDGDSDEFCGGLLLLCGGGGDFGPQIVLESEGADRGPPVGGPRPAARRHAKVTR